MVEAIDKRLVLEYTNSCLTGLPVDMAA